MLVSMIHRMSLFILYYLVHEKDFYKRVALREIIEIYKLRVTRERGINGTHRSALDDGGYMIGNGAFIIEGWCKARESKIGNFCSEL